MRSSHSVVGKEEFKNMQKQQTILVLPGWQDSGPQHWQSLWLKKYPNAVKVEQKNWMHAKKEDWVAGLNNAIQKYKDNDVVLVGHSLACATIAHWSSGGVFF